MTGRGFYFFRMRDLPGVYRQHPQLAGENGTIKLFAEDQAAAVVALGELVARKAREIYPRGGGPKRTPVDDVTPFLFTALTERKKPRT